MTVHKMDPVEAAINALVVTKDATIGEKILIFFRDLGYLQFQWSFPE